MKITNRFGLPQPLVDSVNSDEWYSKGSADISVTQLIGPPQIRILSDKYDDQIEQDVTDRIFMLFGSAVHNILEKANTEGYISEERYYATVDGLKVGGQIDLIEKETGILYDYKTTSTWTMIYEINGKPEREQQTNCYAWLAKQNGIDVKGIKVVCILKDWSKGQAQKRKGEGYPQQPVVTLTLPLWDDSKVETFINSRVMLHKTAEESGVLPPCSAKERWSRDTKIAVMQGGKKRALKLFEEDQSQLAYEMVKNVPGGFIQNRIGSLDSFI